MRIIIPLVVLVAILVGPSAFAQSPSQDNAGQIPNNSGAGVPGLPGNKSGPAHRPNGMTQEAHTPVRARIRATFPDCQAQSRGLRCSLLNIDRSLPLEIAQCVPAADVVSARRRWRIVA
jgi:hypothetical protein